MRIPTEVKIVSVVLAGVALSACGSDPSRPTTLKQQQDAMHPARPSAEELQQAMSKVHFKTPGSNPVQPPPEGVKHGH